jgi:hypothetical protein
MLQTGTSESIVRRSDDDLGLCFGVNFVMYIEGLVISHFFRLFFFGETAENFWRKFSLFLKK